MSLYSDSKHSDRIPISQPCLGELELEYVTEAVRSTWVGPTGFFIEKMKEEFAHEIGVAHAIPVSNGTVALHLALLAVGIEEGDEVIVPSLTYIAPVNAVMYCGGIPVFVDVQEDSWCISPDDILKLITSKTKAIIVVHLYGMPANMNEIMKIAQAHNIRVVEDAAEAMFAKYGNSYVGGIGDIATFSLFGNKILSSGEGGIVTTNNRDLAEKVELLKGQGMDPSRRYWFPVVGFNYRMTNVAAAIFCAQFARRQSLIERRWQVYSTYDEIFSGVDGITIQLDAQGVTRSPWLYPILLNQVTEEKKYKIMAVLESKGIETRPFFIPIHTMPPYATFKPRLELDKTEKLSRIGLNLPTFPDLQVKQAAWIADTLLNVVNETR